MDRVLEALARIEKNVSETKLEIQSLERRIEKANGRLLVRATIISALTGALAGGLITGLLQLIWS